MTNSISTSAKFTFVLVATFTFLCALAHLAQAEERSGNTIIEYVSPKNPQLQEIYVAATKYKLLEKSQELFAPFILPRPLTLRTEDCNGDVNASYENDVISVCYEYLKYIHDYSADKKRPDWVSADDAFLGPAIEVFAHEGGHALFDYFKVPLLGKEEDAADQIAAFSLLNFNPDQSEGLIAGIVNMYRSEGDVDTARQLSRPKLMRITGSDLSDEHSLPLQRMYTAICLALGSGQKGFDEMAKQAALGKDRAELCPGEYQQVAYAFKMLLAPHVDHELAKGWKSLSFLQKP